MTYLTFSLQNKSGHTHSFCSSQHESTLAGTIF